MIVRDLDEVKRLGGYRESPGSWSSARYLLSGDGLGLTLTETRVAAGQSMVMEYRNHFEANLILEGKGTLTDLGTGEVHRLAPGSMYALDRHDRHRLDSHTAMRIACVFTPALKGPETHDESGSYPLLED